MDDWDVLGFVLMTFYDECSRETGRKRGRGWIYKERGKDRRVDSQ